KNKNENVQFKGYLKNYESIAAGPKLGAAATTISKNTSLPRDIGLTDKIISEINEGLSLVTYFGHGAANKLETPIGKPSDYRYSQGAHPVFLYSGCILGNSYTVTSKGEKFILSPSKGAIAWIAESSFSFVGNLNSYTTDFYQNMAQENYGKSLGKIINGTIKDFQNPGNLFNEMQVLQKTYQGDPAIKLYSPSEPDYGIKVKDLFVTPQNASVESDSFAIGIIAKNNGKAINDSFAIKINHTFPDFSTETLETKEVKAPYHHDTELNEVNNKAALEFFLPSSGVFPLFPRPFSIVNKRNVELMVQSNNLFLKNGVYEFQLDTTPSFNSPLLQSSGKLQSGFKANWDVQLPLAKDTTVYYWRARLTNQGKQAKSWQDNSFTYISNSPKGWAQAHFPQFKSSSTEFVKLDSINRKLNFTKRVSDRYLISSAGTNSDGFDFIRYSGGLLYFAGVTQGILMLAVKPENQARFNYPSPYNKWKNRNTVDGTSNDTTSAIYEFDWIKSSGEVDTQVVNDFISHIDSIPKGYHVLAFNGNKHKFGDLGESFHHAMEKIGASKVRSVGNEQPYIIFGRKGAQPGEAEEFTYNENNSTPPDEQTITATNIIYPLRDEGTITSSTIGPAKNWKSLHISQKSLEKASRDSMRISLIGITKDGTKNTLKNAIKARSTQIDWINANQYPYLRIKAKVFDPKNFTPPQINNWRVIYDQ
ncbi:MAG: hypothetical protein BRD49_01240, partial [Bacteroidetes bacterium SW_10_40_5]